jgi:hypothetical protein
MREQYLDKGNLEMDTLAVDLGPKTSKVVHDEGLLSRVNDVVTAGGAQQQHTAKGNQVAVFAGHRSIILIQTIDHLHAYSHPHIATTLRKLEFNEFMSGL